MAIMLYYALVFMFNNAGYPAGGLEYGKKHC